MRVYLALARTKGYTFQNTLHRSEQHTDHILTTGGKNDSVDVFRGDSLLTKYQLLRDGRKHPDNAILKHKENPRWGLFGPRKPLPTGGVTRDT